jgi:ABC-type thiamine transport system substrate-binding protein
VPGTMFVYPARARTPLPEVFRTYAPIPDEADLLPLPTDLRGERVDALIARWTDVMQGGR